MSLFVEGDGSGAARGCDVFNNVVFAAHFLNDCQRAVAVGTDSVSGAGIERYAVGARTDGWRGNNLTFIRIGNRHYAVAADRKEPPFLHIDRQTGRPVAR